MAVLSLCMAIAITLTGCGPGDLSDRAGGTLTVAMPIDCAGLDPHRAQQASPLHTALYGTLLQSRADGTIAAGLASGWHISDDGLRLTLTLREGVRFHDGTAVDGASVAANLSRVVAGGPAAFPVALLLGPVDEITSAARTVTITYERPFPPAWSALADPRLGIVAPATLEVFAAAAAAGGLPAAADVLGSGPLRLTVVTAASLALVPYEQYAWPPAGTANPGRAYPDNVVVNFFDADQALHASTLATADLVWWPAAHYGARDVSTLPSGWRAIGFAGHRMIYLALAMLDDGPLSQQGVREAITMLLDRSSMAHTAGPNWEPRDSLLTRGVLGGAGLVSADGARKNAAASLLARAGWVRSDPDGPLQRDGEPLEIRLATYEGSSLHQQLAREVAAALEDAGILVRHVAPRRVPATELVEGGPNAWIVQYEWPDPDAIFYLFHSSYRGQTNRSGLQSQAVDSYLMAARQEIDPAKRAELYRKADAAIRGAGAATGLLEEAGEVWASPRVAGLNVSDAGLVLWGDIFLRTK